MSGYRDDVWSEFDVTLYYTEGRLLNAIAKIAKPTVETSERYANSFGGVEKNSERKKSENSDAMRTLLRPAQGCC
jgi:hypothetical protein